MTTLGQLLAIDKGRTKDAKDAITRAYHTIQRGEAFNGLERVYRPKDDEGEQLPPESKHVQATVPEVVETATEAFEKLLNVTFEKDVTNCYAKADVRVGGDTLIADAPVSYLLFLEKQLTDMHTFVSKLPTLDPAERWQDQGDGKHRSEAVETHRTKKVPRSFVLYEATDKHAAQVQAYQEDIVVGYWSTTKFSGAISEADRRRLLRRIKEVHEAARVAREQANRHEVDPTIEHAGNAVVEYIFG